MSDIKDQIDRYIGHKTKILAERIVEKQYDKHPGLFSKIGSEGHKINVRDAAYHLPFLTEAILASNPETFRSYIGWVKTLYKGINLPDEIMVKTLECTREVLNEELPAGLSVLTSEYLNYGIDQMYLDTADELSYIDENDNLGSLAKMYAGLLLQGNRTEASNLILSEVKKGTPIKSLYLDVFQKTQYEIGRLWLTGKISVAQEHYCSAATQMIISQLYPYIFSTERNGHRFVAACIGDELHEMGIRMVADFFEMDGWDTYYLGANTPAFAIIKSIEDYDAEILGLSVAMPYHQSMLKDTIEQIRKTDNGKKVKIMIGGNAINRSGIALSYFGADAYAKDALQAVQEGRSLINIS